MPKLKIRGRRRAAGCLTALLLTGGGLTACGGSSGTTTHTSASAVTPASATTTVSPASTSPSGMKPSTGAKPSTGTSAHRGLPRVTQGTHANPPRVAATAFRQALVRFAGCLRQNGANIPAPNTSGKGPLFGSKAIKTNTPQFRAAALKCRSVLAQALRSSAPRAGMQQAPKHG